MSRWWSMSGAVRAAQEVTMNEATAVSTLEVFALVFFAITMIGEALWAEVHRNRRRDNGTHYKGYTVDDTLGSVGLGVGNVFISAAIRGGMVALWAVLYRFRVFDLPTGAWWVWLLLLFAEDACYYWYHRTSHVVWLLWAGHENHHSSEHYNLSTALRQSWTSPLLAIPFWLPLPLLGFPPSMILVMRGVSLMYQYWLHTEWVPKLGWFELVFNTPSHHRVHHATNARYIDKNHAGTLIIWDRMFGTFDVEEETIEYGTTAPPHSTNPFVIATHEWRALIATMIASGSIRGAISVAFGPPRAPLPLQRVQRPR
jgi:sterol desaturase/sphingolipid hydroxylase (fatty acid hydroxylase superfamily)